MKSGCLSQDIHVTPVTQIPNFVRLNVLNAAVSMGPIQGPPQFPPECQQHGVPVVVATHQLRVRRAAALPRVQHHHVDEVLQASGRVESHPRKTSERSLRREHPPMNQPVPEPSQKTGETSAQTNSSAWPTPFSPQKLPSPNPPSLNPPLLKPFRVPSAA